jgi:hypothetical protein
MFGWRTGFAVYPGSRSDLRIAFGGGGAGGLRLPDAGSTFEVIFGGGGGGALATKLEIGFRGGGGGRLQQKALISFMGGGAGFLQITGAPPAWPNGYKHFIEFLIPAENVFDGPHTNFPFAIIDDFSESWRAVPRPLRTVANGGLIENASGWDMRLELADGTPLDFARREWSATTGEIYIRSRIPTLPAADTRVRLYFGKSVVADGQNVAGAHAAYLLALDCRLGLDLTGQNRFFTPTSVDAGELVGDAGDYNGSTSQMTLGSMAAANGLPAVTLEVIVQTDDATQDGTIFSSGPAAATGDGQMGCVLAFERDGTVGGASNTISFKVHTSGGGTRVEGPSFCQDTEVMFLAGRWTSGEAAKLFINDSFAIPSSAGTARTGTTLIERG